MGLLIAGDQRGTPAAIETTVIRTTRQREIRRPLFHRRPHNLFMERNRPRVEGAAAGLFLHYDNVGRNRFHLLNGRADLVSFSWKRHEALAR